MFNALPIDCREFTFIDIGSGKGRALLLASEFSFQRIIGVELLPELHRIAQENIVKFTARNSSPPMISINVDATEFDFPDEPLVVFLFHPLPEVGFRKVFANLQQSLNFAPRPAFLVYANPIFEMVLAADPKMRKIAGTHQWAVYQAMYTPT
jgi:predicted RNA methylase